MNCTGMSHVRFVASAMLVTAFELGVLSTNHRAKVGSYAIRELLRHAVRPYRLWQWKVRHVRNALASAFDLLSLLH